MAKMIKVKSWLSDEFMHLSFPEYLERWQGAKPEDLKTLAMDDPEAMEQLNEIQATLEDLTLKLCAAKFLEKAK